MAPAFVFVICKIGSEALELETVREAAVKVFAPVNVCVPLRWAVSASK